MLSTINARQLRNHPLRSAGQQQIMVPPGTHALRFDKCYGTADQLEFVGSIDHLAFEGGTLPKALLFGDRMPQVLDVHFCTFPDRWSSPEGTEQVIISNCLIPADLHFSSSVQSIRLENCCLPAQGIKFPARLEMLQLWNCQDDTELILPQALQQLDIDLFDGKSIPGGWQFPQTVDTFFLNNASIPEDWHFPAVQHGLKLDNCSLPTQVVLPASIQAFKLVGMSLESGHNIRFLKQRGSKICLMTLEGCQLEESWQFPKHYIAAIDLVNCRLPRLIKLPDRIDSLGVYDSALTEGTRFVGQYKWLRHITFSNCPEIHGLSTLELLSRAQSFATPTVVIFSGCHPTPSNACPRGPHRIEMK